MSNIKHFANELFSKYVCAIKEYFDTMNNSETIKNLANIKSTLLIGLNAMHRVFEIVLLKTKHIDTACYYAQLSINYYSQYMEQICAADLLTSLNHTDAVRFVYKKTVCEICDNDETTQSILNAFGESGVKLEESEIRVVTDALYRFINSYFYWDNDAFNFENRYYLAKFLDNYENNYELFKNVLPYVEALQSRSEMSFEKYEEILKELNKTMKRKKNAAEINKNELLLMKFYGESDTFKNKFNDSTSKDLVKWLIV